MLSTAADLTQLAQLAPWLAVGIVCLGAAVWVYRQQRRSARDQGERLGELERRAESERDRRRQVEAVLIDLGVPLPWWPPDGPDAPRARLRWREDEDQADDPDRLSPETEVRRVPVPPLPDSPTLARHRR